MRPAQQFLVNSVLEKVGCRQIDNFDNPYEVGRALSFLRSLGDRDVIKPAMVALEKLAEMPPQEKSKSINAVPHFTEEMPAGKVPRESIDLSPEGFAKLESTFGEGGRKRRGLVYGGTTLKKFIESQEM